MLTFVLTCLLLKQTNSISLDDDPQLWPGHLEPFGSKQRTTNVEVFTEWPTPKNFFQDFIDKSRPAMFKGLGKLSPAYRLWDDNYLKSHPGADKFLVQVEPDKKENRKNEPQQVTFKKFIEIYHNESVYMVHGVPKGIQKDVLIPPPLRCKETRNLLMDAVTWFSSGGTKSVVHHDDLDNVNCLIRGTKKLLFVDFEKYGQLIHLENGHSSIDVEKVNYTKFPNLRKVEYIRADMEEGDCLFIPYAWIHQVNSKANEKGQNIAVNIWFKHRKYHHPEDCNISTTEATLDKYWFPELEKNQAEVEGREYQENFFEISSKYESYLQLTKKQQVTFKIFYVLLTNDKGIVGLIADKENDLEIPSNIQGLIKKLFDALDITKNGVFSIKDFQYVEEKDLLKEYETTVTAAHTEVKVQMKKYLQELEEHEVDDASESTAANGKIPDEL